MYITSVLLKALYEIFAGCSTDLGTVFIAVGKAELSNKMASYITDRKVFAIKTIYSSGGSCISEENQFREGFLFVLFHRRHLLLHMA
jgi:hypothetical protein